ncbi:XRE family transcriptional regulator [Metamycoplasma equirhinis]|uniref:XRE family transcriptional regulator n=1 Tax=Metamycoplasma equirhinis TaxID=92402 RepID=UPI0035931162
MAEQHICDMKHIKTHGNDFAEEIKYYLDRFSITQKELALRLGISVKHINTIMRGNINDVSVAVIESLEYAFCLETGTLAEVYHIYSNLKNANQIENLEKQLNEYGISFLMEHPELAIAANITIKEATPLHIKLMMLKRFYGVSKLPYYDDYLKTHVLADQETYKNANSKIWIRFCEILAARSSDYENFGVFRKSIFTEVFKKSCKIILNNDLTFVEKIKLLKANLITKGIALVTMPFIENSSLCAIALKKGAKRYIFLSDMYHLEPYILFALLHEIIHCYFPEYNENQIDEKLIKQFRLHIDEYTGEKHIMEKALYAFEESYKEKIKNGNINTSYFWSEIREKYPYVSFDELTDKDKESV